MANIQITDNYSILNLFVRENKEVKIFIGGETVTIYLKSIKEFFSNDDLATCYTIISNQEYRRKLLPTTDHHEDVLEEVKTLIFKYGQYAQYSKIVTLLREQLGYFINGFSCDFPHKELKANDVTITSDI